MRRLSDRYIYLTEFPIFYMIRKQEVMDWMLDNRVYYLKNDLNVNEPIYSLDQIEDRWDEIEESQKRFTIKINTDNRNDEGEAV